MESESESGLIGIDVTTPGPPETVGGEHGESAESDQKQAGDDQIGAGAGEWQLFDFHGRNF